MTRDPAVALHGSYQTDNYGDVLLMTIYARWIRAAWPGVRVVMPSPNVSAIAIAPAGPDATGFRALSGAAALVYGGGGYFGEPALRAGRIRPRNLRRHIAPGAWAALTGRPYMINGVGVHRFVRPVSRFAFGALFRHARAITVRDQESAEHAHELGVPMERLRVTADAALTLTPADIPAEAVTGARELLTGLPGRRRIAVHLARPSRRFPAVASVVEGLARFAAGAPDATFLLVADGSVGQRDTTQTRASAELQERLGPRAVTVPYTDIWSLTAQLGAADLVVTTKLHVGIVAAALGTSVLSFPFHAKVPRLYRQLEAPDRCVPLDFVTPERVEERLASIADAGFPRFEIPALVRRAANDNRQELAKFLAAVQGAA
jgi:polysaccharide pyruvyl transferase WcaK-like protein